MLILESLTLENFGSFKTERTFLFEEGINIIEAENGKGKTTIRQAIDMLLLDNYEGSLEVYINWDASFFNISLKFRIDDTPYLISLNVSKTKNGTLSERILSSNGVDLGKGDDAKRILGELLEPNIARYALIAKQENTDNIVTAKDAERLALIKKIKNYEFDYEVKQQIDPSIQFWTNRATEVDKEIYSLQNQQYTFAEEKPILFSIEEMDSFKQKIESLRKEKERIELNKRTVENFRYSLQKTQQQIATQLDSLTLNKETLKREQQILDALLQEDNKEEVANISEKILQLKKDIEVTIPNNLASLKKQLKDAYDLNVEAIQDSIKKYQDEYNLIKLVKIPKFMDSLLVETEKKSYQALADLNILNKNIADLDKGICPLCHSNCSHIVTDYRKERANLLQYMDDLGSVIADEQKKKLEVEKEIEENNQNKTKKLMLENNIKNEETKLKALELKLNNDFINAERDANTNITKKEYEVKEYEIKIQNILNKYTQDVQNKKTKISDIETYIISIEANLNSLKEEEARLNLVINDYTLEDFLDADLLTSLTEKVNNQEVNEAINKSVRELNASLTKKKEADTQRIAELTNEKIKIIQSKNDLEQARTILLKDFPNYMIEENIQDIEDAMNDFINLVYYKDLNIQLRSTKTVVKLEYGGKERGHPASRLSGAEKRIVQLSFINYFNVLLGLKCIILDEPDAEMDKRRKKELYEAILSMKEIFNQIIIVSHAEEMKQFLIANADANVITL